MKIFVDWADKKKHTYLVGDGDTIHKTEKLDFSDADVFIETGFPRVQAVGKLINQGCEINTVQGNKIAEFRGDRDKSDEDAPFYIRSFYRESPEEFKKMPERRKKEVNMRVLGKKYKFLTDHLQELKNVSNDLPKEYGISMDVEGNKKSLKSKKDKVKKEMESMIPKRYRMFKENITGLGNGRLIKIVSEANPIKYHCLTAFTHDHGYTDDIYDDDNLRGKTKRIRSVMHDLVSNGVVMNKDDRYYPFYKLLKTVAGFDHDQACNRVATFIMKEYYATIRDEMKEDWNMVDDAIDNLIQEGIS